MDVSGSSHDLVVAAPAASLEKAVVMTDVAASSSRPATWEEHVSYSLCLLCDLCFLYAYVAYYSLLATL